MLSPRGRQDALPCYCLATVMPGPWALMSAFLSVPQSCSSLSPVLPSASPHQSLLHKGQAKARPLPNLGRCLYPFTHTSTSMLALGDHTVSAQSVLTPPGCSPFSENSQMTTNTSITQIFFIHRRGSKCFH